MEATVMEVVMVVVELEEEVVVELEEVVAEVMVVMETELQAGRCRLQLALRRVGVHARPC